MVLGAKTRAIHQIPKKERMCEFFAKWQLFRCDRKKREQRLFELICKCLGLGFGQTFWGLAGHGLYGVEMEPQFWPHHNLQFEIAMHALCLFLGWTLFICLQTWRHWLVFVIHLLLKLWIYFGHCHVGIFDCYQLLNLVCHIRAWNSIDTVWTSQKSFLFGRNWKTTNVWGCGRKNC